MKTIDEFEFYREEEAAAIRRVRTALEGDTGSTKMLVLTWMIDHELSGQDRECALAILSDYPGDHPF